MPDDTKIKSFPLVNGGMVLKVDQSRLKDGEFPSTAGTWANIEGVVSTRSGSWQVANFNPGVGSASVHTVRKFYVANPSTGSITDDTNNPRYIGTNGYIWRYTGLSGYGNPPGSGAGSWTGPGGAVCGPGISGTTSTGLPSWSSDWQFYDQRWNMVSYNAGSAGTAYAFFATPNIMRKDIQNHTVPHLQKWGVQPATGAAYVAQGAAITGQNLTLASPTAGANPTNFNVTAHPITDGGLVVINNATGSWITSNGEWVATVVDANNFTIPLDSSTFAGNFNGQIYTVDQTGPFAGAPGATPYDYRFHYVNGIYDLLGATWTFVGTKGNPSVTSIPENMATSVIADGFHKVTVNAWGTGQDGVAATGAQLLIGQPCIAVYRRGGTFTDGLWRLLGYVNNPGAATLAVFTDAYADFQIINNDIMEEDNDPPVTSSLPRQYMGTGSAVSLGAGNIPTYSSFTITPGVFDAFGNALTLTAGTTIHVLDGDRTEDVVIDSSSSATVYTCCFQHNHNNGVAITIDSISGQPVFLCCAAFDSIFVAGDPNNPSTLYKSKTGRPESFPVIASDGTANSALVGSPSNPIMNICEFQGYIVCLNLDSIYTVQIFNGEMLAPQKTLSQRGLFTRYAWCRADNELYFLAYDGVYSWSGGQAIKRSEKIDPIFHGKPVNIIQFTNAGNHEQDAGPIWPIDLYSQVAQGNINFSTMVYSQNRVILIYRDTAGNTQMIQYEPLFDRWTPYTDITNPGVAAQPIYTTAYQEEDTGLCALVRYNPTGPVAVISYIDRDINLLENGNNVLSTTDEWTVTGSNGGLVHFDFLTPWYMADNPLLMKFFKEFLLEVDCPSSGSSNNTVHIQTFYDFSQAPDGIDTFTFNGVPGGGRGVKSFPLQQAVAGGRDARVCAFRIFGDTDRRINFFSVSLRYEERGLLTSAFTSDWNDQGYPWDKRIYSLTIQYVATSNFLGTSSSTEIDFVVDAFVGVNGNLYRGSVASFSLDTALIPATDKTIVVFPMPDGIIAKELRIRGTAEASQFRILAWSFDYEKYPRDITIFSDWQDNNYAYDKYLQQVSFDVDTNGQSIPVQIQADGVTVQTLTVQAYSGDRRRNPTCIGNLTGRKWRYLIDQTQIISAHGTATISGGTSVAWASGDHFTAAMVGMVWDQTSPSTLIASFINANSITLSQALSPGTVNFAIEGKFQVFDLAWDMLPADRGPVTHTFDYEDGGYPYDKRLKEITIDYDNNGGGPYTVLLDLLCGVDGDVLVPSADSYVLPGNSRGKKTFPVHGNLIGKMWRIHPQVAGPLAQSAKIWGHTMDFDKYPADITLFTDWEDDNYGYDKYLQQVSFEVDTAGQLISAQVQADGVTAQTLTVQTLSSSRDVNPTCMGNLIGKKWRIVVDPTQLISAIGTATISGGTTATWNSGNTFTNSMLGMVFTPANPIVTIASVISSTVVTLSAPLSNGSINFYIQGKFQVFSLKWNFQSADRGAVQNTLDYTDLGTPNPKKISLLDIEYDSGGLPDPQIVMDVVEEDGVTITLNKQTFNLTGTGRSKQQFVINDNIIVQMVRLHPVGTLLQTFKSWNPQWQKIDYPPVISPPTEWTDLGYPCEKILRWMVIDADTGGAAGTVTVQMDGVSVYSFQITTTINNRARVITMPENLIGRRFRLLFTPGSSNRFQVFDYKFEALREPCPITDFRSYEQNFGYIGWKFVKTGWLQYLSAVPITFNLFTDGGLFYSITLPAQATRATQKWYFPAINGGVLNKSKIYTIEVLSSDGVTPFKLYAGSSGMEHIIIGADIRTGYLQTILETMPIGTPQSA